jgi:hypothetical protein
MPASTRIQGCSIQGKTRRDERSPTEQGFRLNGSTDAEIEAMAKASAAEFSAQGFFFDDVNPVEVTARLARLLRPPRDEGPRGSAAAGLLWRNASRDGPSLKVRIGKDELMAFLMAANLPKALCNPTRAA